MFWFKYVLLSFKKKKFNMSHSVLTSSNGKVWEYSKLASCQISRRTLEGRKNRERIETWVEVW